MFGILIIAGLLPASFRSVTAHGNPRQEHGVWLSKHVPGWALTLDLSHDASKRANATLTDQDLNQPEPHLRAGQFTSLIPEERNFRIGERVPDAPTGDGRIVKEGCTIIWKH